MPKMIQSPTRPVAASAANLFFQQILLGSGLFPHGVPRTLCPARSGGHFGGAFCRAPRHRAPVQPQILGDSSLRPSLLEEALYGLLIVHFQDVGHGFYPNSPSGDQPEPDFTPKSGALWVSGDRSSRGSHY